MTKLKAKFSEVIQRIRNLTIRSKILFLNLVIIFIPIFLLAFFANNISSGIIVSKFMDNSKGELRLIDKNLQIWSNDFEGYIRLLCSDYRLQAILESNASNISETISYIDVKKSLDEIISNYTSPNIDSITASIINNDDYLFDIGYADNTAVRTVFDSKYIESVKNKQIPVWTSLFRFGYNYSKYEKNNVFAVSKAIIGKSSGKTLGVAILYVNESIVYSTYKDYSINANEKIYIIDKDGTIISTRNKDDLYKNINDIVGSGSFNIKEMKSDSSNIMSINNKKSILSFHNVEKLNWGIISIMPMDDIVKENNQILRLIVLIGGICFVIALLGALLMSYSISKPILKLVGMMKMFKVGDPYQKPDFKFGGEVGMLFDGFHNLMYRNNALLKEIFEEQKNRREYEFKLIQSQIKPHFLYNTLEAIISFIKLKMYNEAITTTKSLASFYRISLSKGNDIITIAEEIQLIGNYLALQKFRYNNYLQYKINVDEDILTCNIPKLTLQPFVENAIYHGIKPNIKGNLEINGYKKGDEVVLEVYDDGVGMSREQIVNILYPKDNNDRHMSFGVSSVDARIKLIYGNQYGIDFDSVLGEYTRIIIKLPFK